MSSTKSSISVRPVILCGGSGTRLWPLSRSGFPKQFLALDGAESLFQKAVRRAASLGDGHSEITLGTPYIVTHETHRFLASEQMRETGIALEAALLEPLGRNTAPAVSFAALAAIENGDDPVLVITPADHVIKDEAAFTSAILKAVMKASEGDVVILGIHPTRPETGYGYIKVDAREDHEAAYRAVVEFVEKPDSQTANRYIQDGGYYWNAGIFVLKASKWLAALGHFQPEMEKAAKAAWQKRKSDGSFIRPGAEEYERIKALSVDYAVLEHCPKSPFPISMVPLDAGWSDLGAWDALWDILPKDENHNALAGDVVAVDTRNTLAHASTRLVSLVGVENLIVIETADAVLVADKTKSQDVRKVVDALKAASREEETLHRKVHRPWGWYDSVDEEARFKVKRIMVKPGASLSLQKHHHRAEHWVVVKGTAEVTCGDKVIMLSENQSTYIPLGEVHRLKNPGVTPLEIIEVQSGSYLGEDDIVRYQDNYGREIE